MSGVEISQIVSALIFGLAGALFFFTLFNRLILQFQQGFIKSLISYSSMVISTIPVMFYGFLVNLGPEIVLPVSILLIACFGELYRRWWQKKHHRRKPSPINSDFNRDRSFLTTDHLLIRKCEVPVQKMNGPRIRIVHLSDLHFDQNLPASYFRKCFTETSRLNPDFIFLTGDFSDDPNIIRQFIPDMRSLKSRFGVYGVLGNHDYYAGADDVRSVLVEAGVEILSDTCQSVAVDNGNRVNICGTEYPWSGISNSSQYNGDMLNIVLSHTPDNIFDLSRKPVDFVFSGHLHGGQWRFPLIGSLVIPSIRGRLLDYGHFRINETHLFVTSGVGTVWIPYRIRCEPEILVVDIKQSASNLGE